MFSQISEKIILKVLHRNLYLLEEEEKKLDAEKRYGLYRLLKYGWEKLSSIEKDFVTGQFTKADIEKSASFFSSLNDKNINVITWSDSEYPIKNLEDPPPLLYIRGTLPDPAVHPCVAIVGSRKASSYGTEMTEKIVSDLKPYGAAIVSGLAYGIDITAHKAALKEGLLTVAVLGSGIDQIYPSHHRPVAEEIIKCGGAVISEFPWGTPPLRHNFPMRNRVISAIAKGVIVTEAVIKSGSLITARWAAEQGKPVCALPGTAGRVLSSGTNHLIKEGAHLIENGTEAAGILGLQLSENNSDLKKGSGQNGSDDGIRDVVRNFLAEKSGNFDILVKETGLPIEKLLPLITEIELETGKG